MNVPFLGSKERDNETGQDYFGVRYYASAQGRFVSTDWSATPVAVPYADLNDPQTLNLYGYVRNNPLWQMDKDGHAPDWWKKLKNWASNGGWTADDQQAEKTRREREVKTARFFANEWAKEHPSRHFDQSKYSDDQIVNAFHNGAFSKTADDPMDPLQIFGIVYVGAIVWTGPYDVSDFKDVTKRGADVANQELNANVGQFEQKLQANGYTKGAASDGSPQFTKGNETITIYSKTRSTGSPTAQVKINDQVVAKIRLKPINYALDYKQR